MKIEKEWIQKKLILRLSGYLDSEAAPDLQNVMEKELPQAEDLEIDFAQLEYVTSAGLRVLLLGAKTMKKKDGMTTAVNVNESVMNVFEMTGFNEILLIK